MLTSRVWVHFLNAVMKYCKVCMWFCSVTSPIETVRNIKHVIITQSNKLHWKRECMPELHILKVCFKWLLFTNIHNCFHLCGFFVIFKQTDIVAKLQPYLKPALLSL